jgi:hypothetical protein
MPLNNRYEIYHKFNHFIQKKDTRPMDEICINNTFQLQAQQLFLREYMTTYPDWKSLLLYHEIGSGKTCTAITMGEEYLKLYPNNKIKVILPARLRTNFIDELVSPCGMDAYISQEDFAKYHDSKTKLSQKQQIKTRFMHAIAQKYDIMSFEKFKINIKKHSHDLLTYIQDFTKDCLIIIDEVHNLLSDKYDAKKLKEILQHNKFEKTSKGMSTILFRYLTTKAHPTCKLILLTATPIFDNISQLKELVLAMNPDLDAIASNTTLKQVINHLRGKVSYFPGTSINSYPKVNYQIHEIPFTKLQDQITSQILDDNDNEFTESFMAKQRQVSLACLPGNKSIKSNISDIIENLRDYSPKINKLVNIINNESGKHVVYSNFVQSGLRVVEAALRHDGWKSLFDKDKEADKVFALWDGSVKDADKQIIKNIVNSKENIFGEKLRVILGSPSIKEGVSFKHIQHIHILDPVWNQSAKTQVEGRAIRYCSHVDIDPQIHAPLKRQVTVDIYKSMPRHNGLVGQTCDQMIYDVILERKKSTIRIGENALKKVAIDHYLFRDMYEDKKHKSPKYAPESDISVQANIGLNYKRINRKANTCPKPRRPDENGECPENMFKATNSHGDDCCYKTKRQPAISTCPKSRQPIDNKCKDGYYIKENKANEPCCYKETKKYLASLTT